MFKEILIEALKYFIPRLTAIFLFIGAFILYIIVFKVGDKVGKWIMKIYERFKK
jgi:hypothetical protein